MAEPAVRETFQRVETKYRLTDAQREDLFSEIGPQLCPDVYGKSTVCSLYLDTPSRLLIRNSIEAKGYKEKLRLRSYGTPGEESRVFLEIKKKYCGVVYKRRVVMPLHAALAYLADGKAPVRSQMMAEIDYAMRLYGHPQPAMLIAYEREAYTARDIPDLRLTVDFDVRFRTADLALEHGHAGQPVLPPGVFLLEVKSGGAMPLWLSHALNRRGIFPVSFSKYGTAYRMTTQAQTVSSH